MELQVSYDNMRSGLMVRLCDDVHYVQTLVPDEALTRAADLPVFKEEVIKRLCHEWLVLYGEKWTVLPAGEEGTQRTFTRHETIDGEVVVKEIEAP